MKAFLRATSALFFFKRYTSMPRGLEIAYGILAWCNLILFVFSLYRLLITF